jgi:hypothetical protein
MMSVLCCSYSRLKNLMCTSATKCLLSSPVFKPRPENSDSDEKEALFGLGTQLTINYAFDFLLFEYGSRS